jgi:uncharacterized protein YdaT
LVWFFLLSKKQKIMWTKTNYPEAMKNLPEEVRSKALAIANARLEDDVDPNQRTLIATSIRLAEAGIRNKKKQMGPDVNRKADAVQKKILKTNTVKKRQPRSNQKKTATQKLHRGDDLHLIPSHPKVLPETNETNKEIQATFNHDEEVAMHEGRKKSKRIVSRDKRILRKPRQS